MDGHKKGFTVIELIIIISILAILFTVSSVNLLGFYSKNTLATSVTTLLSDMRQQQLKAMVGHTEGQATHDAYGIYFQSDRYTLFKGPIYSSSDPTNFAVVLNPNLQFSTIFVPGSQIVFTYGSGQFTDYDSNFNYITLKNIQTDETQTLQLNQFGTVVSIY